MSRPVSRSRCWIFRISNPLFDEDQRDDPSTWNKEIKYLVYQVEESESHLIHVQGYVSFINARTFNQVKLIHPRAHWEIRMGTVQEAAAYCMKEETRIDGPYEFGTPPVLGGIAAKKSSYAEMHTAIVAGASPVSIQDSYPSLWYRHRSTILATISDRLKHRDFQTISVVYWGPTGVGKSRRAIAEAKAEFGDNIHIRMKGDWWDGYIGQPAIIINDFYGWIQYDEMLRILDRYPHQVPVKGAFCKFIPRKIWITSNEHPQNWYPKVYERFPYANGALERRLMQPNGNVIFMDQPWNETYLE